MIGINKKTGRKVVRQRLHFDQYGVLDLEPDWDSFAGTLTPYDNRGEWLNDGSCNTYWSFADPIREQVFFDDSGAMCEANDVKLVESLPAGYKPLRQKRPPDTVVNPPRIVSYVSLSLLMDGLTSLIGAWYDCKKDVVYVDVDEDGDTSHRPGAMVLITAEYALTFEKDGKKLRMTPEMKGELKTFKARLDELPEGVLIRMDF